MGKKRKPIKIELRITHRYAICDRSEKIARHFLSILDSFGSDQEVVRSLVERKADSIVESFAEAVRK
jgi:hypothetical protein